MKLNGLSLLPPWSATKVIKAPYNIVIVMTLGTQTRRNRIQDVKSNTWVKYPITY